jgi:hypothetical protein
LDVCLEPSHAWINLNSFLLPAHDFQIDSRTTDESSPPEL